MKRNEMNFVDVPCSTKNYFEPFQYFACSTVVYVVTTNKIPTWRPVIPLFEQFKSYFRKTAMVQWKEVYDGLRRTNRREEKIMGDIIFRINTRILERVKREDQNMITKTHIISKSYTLRKIADKATN